MVTGSPYDHGPLELKLAVSGVESDDVRALFG